LSESCEQILSSEPNGKIVIAGDINQLDIKDLTSQHAFQQMVKVMTRGQRTLDVFITNCLYLWKSPTVSQRLVRSDHLAVMVHPCTTAKPLRKFVYFRDVREHRKIKMENNLNNINWESVTVKADDPCESVRLLNESLSRMFN
jgi:hypothetical protein